MTYLCDTNFLIGLWRHKKGEERDFVRTNPGALLKLCWMVKAEFLRGALVAHQNVDEITERLQEFSLLWPTDATLLIYAKLYAQLRKTNTLIGPNDLWIAACALEHRLPLLTKNRLEFSRVEKLSLVDW